MAFGNKEHKTKKIACLRPTIKHASASKKKKKNRVVIENEKKNSNADKNTAFVLSR